MQVTVFGANGKVGSKIVAKLLAKNYSVTAFIHTKSSLQSHPKLKICKGDIKQPADVARALKNSDAAIAAVGSWGTKSKDILSSGMVVIIGEMKRAKIKRIISLTGADARDITDKPQLINKLSHALLSVVSTRILQDGEEHIRLLRESSLEWTVIRSPVMRENSNEEYALGLKLIKPWASIKRESVADAMIKVLEENLFIRQSPIISRKKL